MTRRRLWLLLAVVVVAVATAAVLTRSQWSANNAAAQATRAPARVVPVETTTAERRPVPVRVEALGNVTTIASVAIKPRIESIITGVHFADGALVKEGDLLFTLDSRQIEAMIRQAEGLLARDTAQLEQAERDVQRLTELVGKGAGTQVNLDNARTQAGIFRASVKANRAALENLRVQLSYCQIRASISGRMSQANVKVGNLVRPADTAPLATINQVSPVYVSFAVPQRLLPDLRQAIAAESATVEAVVPGDARRGKGAVSMIENTVDPATGMVTIRATMPNEDEVLWPGTLVTAEITLRVEEAIAVPSAAVQISQTGNFVFVVRNETAQVQPVKVARTFQNLSVIGDGLQGGEVVVTDGQSLLSNGTRVAPRGPRTGS